MCIVWQQVHRAVWKDLKSTFKQLDKSLDLHAQFIKAHASRGRVPVPFSSTSSQTAVSTVSSPGIRPGNTTSVAEDLARYRVEVKEEWEDFRESEVQRKREQKERIKGWIQATNKMSDLHKEFLEKRHGNTGRWLFRQYGEVSNWITEEEPHNSAIWLQANKGFGQYSLSLGTAY